MILSFLYRKDIVMHEGRLVFAQLMDLLPRHELDTLIQCYGGHHRLRRFSCYDQWLTMAFAQLTGRKSLRDIETCLRAMSDKLYHAGFRGRVSRSTVADANERRDWRIWADLAGVLIKTARRLYAGQALDVDLENTVYALDATTIDVCLSLFPWARVHDTRGAIKVHTLLDLRGAIPCHVWVSDANTYDAAWLDRLSIDPGALYIMDRGYTDFKRLHRLARSAAWFIIRAKTNLKFTRRHSYPVDKQTGLRCDQTINLVGSVSARHYPDQLRRIAYYDADTKKRLVFLTNHFDLPPLTVTQLYRLRWQVELFFKWIKQHLCIKAFFGTSPNAVKTQIWIAISVYVLVAIVKKQLRIERSMNEILQVLNIALFENMTVKQLLMRHYQTSSKKPDSIQLKLFDF
jgi:hypothetical protein